VLPCGRSVRQSPDQLGDTFAQQLCRTRAVSCDKRQPRGAHAGELGGDRSSSRMPARTRRVRSRWRVSRISRRAAVEAHVPALRCPDPVRARRKKRVISSGERVRMGPGAVGGLGMDSSSSTSSAGAAARVGSSSPLARALDICRWVACRQPSRRTSFCGFQLTGYRCKVPPVALRHGYATQQPRGSRVPRYTALRRAPTLQVADNPRRPRQCGRSRAER